MATPKPPYTARISVRASAESQTGCAGDAVLWLWPGQAIYAGPALDLETHSGSVACLAVGLDGLFTVRGRGGRNTPCGAP